MLIITAIAALALAASFTAMARGLDDDRIRPYEQNPYFWQYKGAPVLLLGGSWQDNLFNHPVGLEEHLDLLVSVGGNYVRNTMSHRNEGNVFAYAQNADGKFDLDRFNEEYWDRFENFLKLTHERDIIVQIEIWETWDYYQDHQSIGGWSRQPFNPANNVNYTPEESGLPAALNVSSGSRPTSHPFFRTVPALDNNEVVLWRQTAFVDKMLSHALRYPHVLYCMNNETGENVAWSDFWARHVRDRAAATGTRVETADMRRNRDITFSDHRHMMDNPGLYTYLDISQNNWLRGQAHQNAIRQTRDLIAGHPRPMNNTKVYTGDSDPNVAVRRWWQNIFGGCASARFHRPHPLEAPEDHEKYSTWGLGLSPLARAQIGSARTLMNELGWPDIEPDPGFVSLAPGSPHAVQTEKTHVVFTRSADGKARLYIDGALAQTAAIAGDLSGWDAGMRLALASELTGERPWLGTYHRVALHSRVLEPAEIAAHTAAGDTVHRDSIEALYAFDEGSGTDVRDTSGKTPALDLHVGDADAVTWLADGLGVNAPVLIATADPAERLVAAFGESSAFTLEAWITPADTHQAGPARIVTLSRDTSTRNFTLGQLDDNYQMRFRTTATDGNGLPGLGNDVPAETTLAAARSSNGDRAAVFVPLGAAVRVDTTRLAGNPRASWLDPRTCAWHNAAPGPEGSYVPPTKEDWVLVFR
jgi:hypothetical protein